MFEVKNVSVKIGKNQILENISFQVAMGELVTLIGPSGSGKSTLLRALMGFLPLSEGEIIFKDSLYSNKNYTLAPAQRNFGIVFQGFNLFTHLNVKENISFGIHKWPKVKRDSRVADLLNLFSLTDKQRRSVSELSGGEKQRVAIARAMARFPSVIFFDEPFSNLDPKMRIKLREEIRQILKAENISGIMVSHDKDDAFCFGDKVILLNNGKLIQEGTSKQLYDNPSDLFVAEFLGSGLLLPEKAKAEYSYFPKVEIFEEKGGFRVQGIIKKSIFSAGIYKNSIFVPKWNKTFSGIASIKHLSLGRKVYLGLGSKKKIQASIT
jgi:ABC-type Fe3+/spermidine/putrescine transport system ATPase subunit